MTQIKPEEAEEILGDPVTDNEQKPKSELLEKVDALARWMKSDADTARSAFEKATSCAESEHILDDLLDQVEAAISGPLAELREVAAKADAEIRRLEAELADNITLVFDLSADLGGLLLEKDKAAHEARPPAVPDGLVTEIDWLLENGIFGSRTEQVLIEVRAILAAHTPVQEVKP